MDSCFRRNDGCAGMTAAQNDGCAGMAAAQEWRLRRNDGCTGMAAAQEWQDRYCVSVSVEAV